MKARAMSLQNRNRLLNAIVFFTAQLRACGKVQLFTLLYLLDFEHFRQTGCSVTGAGYQAWKCGPVPIELMAEWDEPGADLACRIAIVPAGDGRREVVRLQPGVQFEDDDFTPRQLQLMAALVARFHDAAVAVDTVHEQNGAWHQVWQDGAGCGKVIPYALALDDTLPAREQVLAVAREKAMYQAALLAARDAVATP